MRAQTAFVLITLLISVFLIRLASWRLRPTALTQTSRPQKRERPDAPARLVDYLPGPPLDANPVLWREWHRKRPSRWTGRFWTAYAVLSTLASLYVLGFYYNVWGQDLIGSGVYAVAARVNAWQVSIGLLLLSISAATSLAEERDRGSLDVIMTTPLETREIVWGKWWGTYAMVPRLAILPIWVSAGAAMITDGFLGMLLMIGLILAYAAAITSLGLAAATWIPRLGRVITVCVVSYLLLSLGWPLFLDLLASRDHLPNPLRGTANYDGLVLGSPYFGISETTKWACWVSFASARYDSWGYGDSLTHGQATWPLIWIGVYTVDCRDPGYRNDSQFRPLHGPHEGVASQKLINLRPPRTVACCRESTIIDQALVRR